MSFYSKDLKGSSFQGEKTEGLDWKLCQVLVFHFRCRGHAFHCYV